MRAREVVEDSAFAAVSVYDVWIEDLFFRWVRPGSDGGRRRKTENVRSS